MILSAACGAGSLRRGWRRRPNWMPPSSQRRPQAEDERAAAWERYTANPRRQAQELAELIDTAAPAAPDPSTLQEASAALRSADLLTRRQLFEQAQAVLMELRSAAAAVRRPIIAWKETLHGRHRARYRSHLYSEGDESPLQVASVAPEYGPDAPRVRGFEVLKANFDVLLDRDPRVCIFGEDVGRLGDVNQGWPGCRRSTATCAWPTPASARRPLWGRRSGWRCAGCGRSPRSSIWTTFSMHCQRCPTTWPACAGARPAGRRRRSSSARAATAWKGSGTPARRWRR